MHLKKNEPYTPYTVQDFGKAPNIFLHLNLHTFKEKYYVHILIGFLSYLIKSQHFLKTKLMRMFLIIDGEMERK